ncbi:MAG TPA: serine hydrolase domain-containing protein [Polyangiales bacterium]|nr:serine hydrolase domain-containing protein [Polyangiales bacterium]
MAANVLGECDPAFEPVRAAFAQNFSENLELGAAVAIQIGGQTVVSLWSGLASRSEQEPWREDTLVNAYSTTKGLAAMCVQHLVDRGAIDLEQPVARYWPEFAAAGKSEIRVRELLGHRAGLCALREPLPHEAIYDHDLMARALAAAPPLWPPGTRHAYHAQTFGFLLAELVRRTAGRTLGQYFREHFAGPLGAEAYIGLPAEHDARVAKLIRPLGEVAPAGEMNLMQVMRDEPESLTSLAFGNPPSAPGSVNTRRWRGAEIPSSNGHVSALGLARVYGALAAGSGGPLSREGVARCSEEYSYGHDEVLRLTTRFGPGFMLSQAAGGGRFGPNPKSFGHPGLGGSIGFADPDAGIGFGYVMNRAGAEILVGARPRRLIEALYGCV